MENKIKETIEKFNMCKSNSDIVVGVSGGADSIALLHYLCTNSKINNWNIKVVHINHGLRGRDGDDDMEFVENFCKNLGVECKVFRFDINDESKKRKLGTEETGRIIRYHCFKKIAGENGLIAVAHNEDDQSETVLMRLCRGANLRGLGGIRPVNGNIIRPLLFVSRSDIEDYCQRNELDFAKDKTNFETIYTRNKMRLEIIPKLENIYPKARKHIAKAGFYMAEEDEFLYEMTEKYFEQSLVKIVGEKGEVIISNNDNNIDDSLLGVLDVVEIVFDLQSLRDMHIVILRRVIIEGFSKIGLMKNFTAIHIENIVSMINSNSMKEISLPNDIFVRSSYNKLIFAKGKRVKEEFCHNIEINSTFFVEEIGKYISISLQNKINEQNFQQVCNNDYTKVFDYDKMLVEMKNSIFEICCRNRKIGDKIPMLQDGKSKSLKNYFIDEKIPKENRDFIYLIAHENMIFWVVGYKVCDKFLADENTTNFLTIKFMEDLT